MKTQIRHNYLNIRNRLTYEYVQAHSREITENFLNSEFAELPSGKSIMLYASFNNEVNTWQLIEHYHNSGAKVILPKASGNLIIPYEYNGINSLKKDSFGIMSPDEKKCSIAKAEDLHTIIVPGIAFSTNGNRLGFGKGYYDRFLSQMSDPVTIGLCYEFQITDNIPSDDTDIPMHYLLTEKRLINCKG